MLDRTHQLQQQVLLNSQEFVKVGGQDVRKDLDIERIIADSREADRKVADFHLGVLVQNLARFLQHLAQLVRARVPAQTECLVEPDLVAGAEILELDSGKLAVGYADHGAVERPNTSGAQSDMGNCPYAVVKAAEISHQYGTVADHRDTAEQVFDRLLGRQCNRQSAYTEARQQGCCVISPGAERCKYRDQKQKHLNDLPAQREDRVGHGSQ